MTIILFYAKKITLITQHSLQVTLLFISQLSYQSNECWLFHVCALSPCPKKNLYFMKINRKQSSTMHKSKRANKIALQQTKTSQRYKDLYPACDQQKSKVLALLQTGQTLLEFPLRNKSFHEETIFSLDLYPVHDVSKFPTTTT